jgi:CheY-like chemotaxis protein
MDRPIRVLIVDDDVLPAMHLEVKLKAQGYLTTGIAATGPKAIQSARRDKPDLILMDIRLAGEMDGVEAAGLILAESRVALIFLTSYEDKELRERASHLDPLAYLIKPVEAKSLGELIAAHFQR